MTEPRELTSTLVAQLPDAEALAEWAHNRGKELAEARAAEQFELGEYDENGLPLARMYVRHDGTALFHDLTKYRARPVDIVADRVITDPLAFADYVDRHKTKATTIWADGDVVRAVLDDHDPASAPVPELADITAPAERTAGRAGWGRHRASLVLATAPEWKGWKGLHRVLVPQAAFAETVEEFANTLVTPDPETMLLIAQSITVASTGQVSSSISLKDGAVNLTVTEQLEANAGTRDHALSIPTRITFSARRWLGVPPTEMTARLRYRAERGGLKLGLIIDRLEDVEDTYRRNLATSVADATGCPVYAGTP